MKLENLDDLFFYFIWTAFLKFILTTFLRSPIKSRKINDRAMCLCIWKMGHMKKTVKKTRVSVGFSYSEKFEVKIGVHQGSVLSPLLFAIAVIVTTEKAIGGVCNELLHADDPVLMSKAIENLKQKCWNWKDALENMGVMINIRKTKVMRSKSKGKL